MILRPKVRFTYQIIKIILCVFFVGIIGSLIELVFKQTNIQYSVTFGFGNIYFAPLIAAIFFIILDKRLKLKLKILVSKLFKSEKTGK